MMQAELQMRAEWQGVGSGVHRAAQSIACVVRNFPPLESWHTVMHAVNASFLRGNSCGGRPASRIRIAAL